VLIEVLNDEKIDPVLSHFQIVAVAVEYVKMSRRYIALFSRPEASSISLMKQL